MAQSWVALGPQLDNLVEIMLLAHYIKTERPRLGHSKTKGGEAWEDPLGGRASARPEAVGIVIMGKNNRLTNGIG